MNSEMETWEDLIAGRISAQNMVKKTVSLYKDNKDAGTVAVTQWIIDACSCKHKVQTVESIPDLAEQLEKDLTDNGLPVLEKKSSVKLCQLMKLLIKKCEHSVLYDQFLIRIVCHFLCKLSGSEIREFRHVTTLAGLSIASELAELCHNLEKQRNNIDKQLNTERDFTVEREVSWQESLTSSLSEVSENLQEATLLLRVLAQKVLKCRIRDVSSKIRLFCCETLKSWLEEYPDIFVTDENMEIVHVMMFDPLKNIRMFSLKIIESLISNCSDGGPIQTTKKFLYIGKERLIAMTLHSPGVAAQAIRVIALIYKFFPSLLNEKEKEQLYPLVFSVSKKVAQEAAAYVLQVSRTYMEEDGSTLLENIICFFIEFEMQFHCPGYEILYVDSLWDICKQLHDWKQLIECFLHQNDANRKIAYLRILVSCIHRAVTGETPRYKGQEHFKEPIMTVERSKCKMIEDQRKIITEIFFDYLPEIIKQNMKEERILIEVLKIPLYFQTEVYGCNMNQKPLEALLDILAKVFLFTNDDSVLNSIAEVYELLSSPDVATSNMTAVKCAMLMGTIVDVTKKTMGTYQDTVQETIPPIEINYEMEKWTKKLCYLTKCIDVRSYNIYNEIIQFIGADILGHFPVPEEALCYMLRSCFHGIKMSVKKSAETDETSVGFKNMLDDVQKFIQHTSALLSSSSKAPSQKEAFIIFCDLVYFLHVFCTDHPNLDELIYKPDGYMEDRLIHILNEWVFVLPDSSEASVIEISLDERKRMIKGFWDLITCYALPIDCAENIFKFYTLFPEYEDYLQQMLKVLLKFNSSWCAEILVNVLWSQYRGFQTRNTSVNLNFIKEMARRFAAVFDTDSKECREGVTAVQKKAIYQIRRHEDWSESINFMGNFTDFAQITHESDVDDMLNYLQQNIPISGQHDTRELAPFNHYVDCLKKVKKSL